MITVVRALLSICCSLALPQVGLGRQAQLAAALDLIRSHGMDTSPSRDIWDKLGIKQHFRGNTLMYHYRISRILIV